MHKNKRISRKQKTYIFFSHFLHNFNNFPHFYLVLQHLYSLHYLFKIFLNFFIHIEHFLFFGIILVNFKFFVGLKWKCFNNLIESIFAIILFVQLFEDRTFSLIIYHSFMKRVNILAKTHAYWIQWIGLDAGCWVLDAGHDSHRNKRRSTVL